MRTRDKWRQRQQTPVLPTKIKQWEVLHVKPPHSRPYNLPDLLSWAALLTWDAFLVTGGALLTWDVCLLEMLSLLEVLCLWLSPPSVPPGAFVILFWKAANPTVGLKNRVQMPHPGTTPKLYFPVNKLQMPYLWPKSLIINLIKTRKAPYANRP